MEVCGTTWTFSPLAVKKLIQTQIPSSHSTSRSIFESSIINLKNILIIKNNSIDFFFFVANPFVSLNVEEDLVKAAANGDITLCEFLITQAKANVSRIILS